MVVGGRCSDTTGQGGEGKGLPDHDLISSFVCLSNAAVNEGLPRYASHPSRQQTFDDGKCLQSCLPKKQRSQPSMDDPLPLLMSGRLLVWSLHVLTGTGANLDGVYLFAGVCLD